MYRDFKTTVLQGPPGSGKSHFIRHYIQEILDDPNDHGQLILIDPKHVELREFAKSPKTLCYLFKDIANDFDKITFPILNHRFIQLKEGKSNQDEVKLYFFFDEYLDAFPADQENADKAIKTLINSHAQLNIELIIATQREGLPPFFLKKADTTIRFDINDKEYLGENGSPDFVMYRDFRSSGISGDQLAIKNYLSSYEKTIPSGSPVYKFSASNGEEPLTLLENLASERSKTNKGIQQEKWAFAFINIDIKLMQNLHFFVCLKNLISIADKAKIVIVVFTQGQEEIPLSIQEKLQTHIHFPVTQ